MCLAIGLTALPACAQSSNAANISDLVNALGEGDFNTRVAAIQALVASHDPSVKKILDELSDGQLYASSDGGPVYLQGGTDDAPTFSDPITGKQADPDSYDPDSMGKVKINNNVRNAIDDAMSQLTLLSPDRDARFAAAEGMLKDGDPKNLDLLNEALASEKDAHVKKTMQAARAVILLKTNASDADKEAAIDIIAAQGDLDAVGTLTAALANAPAELKPDIQKHIASINEALALWGIGQNVWYGISLGSVLLLAAIGLAITFGVMGVINMAHGEMVMLGAYTTYVVENLVNELAPGLADYSIIAAVPAAFLFTGLVGVIIERGLIRWLYGRPLETLLATWGLSLILQQAVRTIFGASNVLVSAPSWMSGAFELGHLQITLNRLVIVIFAILIFAILQLVLNRTPLGLQMRAVTQNRRMASAMGIRTPFVDAMTFGLGSGIAGIAGVALTQIDNVSPNLGQNYIIDSFMVVVFGGVGNLWGTLVGALTLGVANKFLEPYAGAVLGKIAILVFIILFIQRRPRGLFALKGRAVE
ncbi:MAG TPA: urea ABC transporter permease subunit UrtB [Devosiaceae bacterium]|nr:urea ABC transporter permease subunit UrtB [Devosiaceae bacterium]